MYHPVLITDVPGLRYVARVSGRKGIPMAGLMRARLRRATVLAGALILIPVGLVVAAPPAVAVPKPGGDITTVCTGTDDPVAKTFTLNADCGEVTSPLTVPEGYTVEGGGHIDHRHRPRRQHEFQRWRGDECPRPPGATMMHVNNVIIRAVGFAEHGCAFQTPGPDVQVGLFFDDADGTATRRHCPATSPSTPAARPATGSVPTHVPGQHARSRSPASP